MKGGSSCIASLLSYLYRNEDIYAIDEELLEGMFIESMCLLLRWKRKDYSVGTGRQLILPKFHSGNCLRQLNEVIYCYK
jgi:hypothetical protein